MSAPAFSNISVLEGLIKASEDSLKILYSELQKAKTAALIYPPRPVGTKLTWTEDPYTYRVAVFTEQGLIQVKSVTDSINDMYVDRCSGCQSVWNSISCRCDKNKVWRNEEMIKPFFKNETEWRSTLPECTVCVTKPVPKIMLEPLVAKTDALKLKELSERFINGVFIISTPHFQANIEYRYMHSYNSCDTYINHQIYTPQSRIYFTQFCELGEDINLIVEKDGVFTELTHLL
jgi:hypothetical protein